MTPQEHAHAQALNEFEDAHDSPEHWAPWERDEFELYVPARERTLLALPAATPMRATTDITTGETTR